LQSDLQEESLKEAELERRVYRPYVNLRLCIGCGDCVIACPINKTADLAIDRTRTILSIRNGTVIIEHAELCDGCGICVEACLPKALSIEFPIQEED